MGGEGYAWASRLDVKDHWEDFISDMFGGFFLIMFLGIGRRGVEAGGGRLLNMSAAGAWSEPATQAMVQRRACG
jgi:hypothetical protein